VSTVIGTGRPERFTFGPKERATLTDPLIANNPITVQMLGVCSALAITTRVDNALVMSVGVILVAMVASLAVSLIRERIPTAIRIIVQLAIIASLVTVFDQVLKATFYEISLELSVFVGLIITNCMVLGRAEGYAMHHPPFPAVLDALGNALGYALILVIVAATRELLGAGKLLGFQVLPLTNDGGWFEPNGLMVLPPSALFVIGLLIWAMRTWWPSLVEKD
jgi:Na+-transporting NADH:ubiquinone oxidoreductase subunit D